MVSGQAYAQGSDGRARGSIAFGDGRTVITLFKDADLSTLLHESTHLWLDELIRDATRADAPEGLRADLAAAMQWMKVEAPGMITAMHHEKWARAGESYLMEGKAPSAGLEGAFSRFRAWLVSIYRALHGTGSAINDNIRGVFDRLIATDEQIAAKAEQQRLGRLFASAEQAGMTEAEFRAYVAAADTAREEARTTVERKAMAEIRRVQTEWWKAEEATLRAEVKGEMSRRPDLAALTYLRTGRMPDGSDPAVRLRLSRDALVQLLGSEAGLSLLPKGVPPIVVKKGGVHPDFVDELFGYRSGEEMVKALMAVEAQQRDLRKAGDRRSVLGYLIDRETRSRMVERHGDMLEDGSIEDKALAAVHNDRQGEVLATELRTLAKRSGRDGATTPAALARQWAARLIAEKTVRDAIAVDRYVRAEAAAGRAAEKALLAGDHAEASRQKERQLLNHALVMEAKRAADDVDGAVAMLVKLAAKPSLKGMAQDHLEQIHGLLERFDFRYAPQRVVERRKALAEWVAEQHDQGNEVAVPTRLLDESGRQHYTDMTVKDMRGLADAVRNIAHLGRLKQRLLDGKEQREFDAVIEEAVRQAADLPQRDLPRERNPDGPWHGFTTMLQGFDASLLKMEQVFDWLDGHQEDGVFNRVIFRRAAERQGLENDLRRVVAGELKVLNARLGPELRAGFDRYLPDLHELPDSRTGEPTRMRKSELLALALNVGNESNFDKLTRGERWSPDAVWTALQRHLTRADWTYVQGVWDLLDHNLWPQVEAMERRMSGVAPEKVAAREFTVRPADGGEPITLRGGYYPVVYDPLRAFDVEQRRQLSAERLFENNYQRATTPKGHTVERVDSYARPLHLSLDVLPHHLEAVVHDLAWREFIMDADRFLGDRRIREAVEHTLGREVYKQFRPWLQGIANDRAYDPRGLAWWDRSAHWARTNTTMVGLGYRLTTMLVHGSTAASNSIGEVGAKWMGVGVREFFGGPDKMARARDFVFERSAEMRHRMNETDRDVRDGLRELRGQTGPVAQARRFAYYGISMLDMASAMPTWIGAYRKAMSEGKVEVDAVFSADKAVRNAHGGGGIKDLAAIQRGNEFQKLATMFYSFWNHFYNRQRDLGRRMGLAWEKAKDGEISEAGHDFAMVLARSWFYFVLPQIFHGLFKTGGPDEDHGWLPWAAEEIALGLVSGIPVARDVANSAFTGRDYQATPVASMVESLLNTGHDAAAAVGIGEHEPSERWLRHAIETTGYVFGLPTGQLGTGVQFTWDVMRGEQRADDLADWLRGIAIGGPRKAH